MSTRDDVLTRVRAAVNAVTVEPQEVPRGYRQARPEGDMVDLFVERVEDYRAVVTRCRTHELTEQIRSALAGADKVIVPQDLDLDVPGAVPDSGQDAATLNRIEAVVTRSSVGIAVTGTIVMEHGKPGQGRRALSLVPDRHVCIVAEGDIVPDVPQAVSRLDPQHPQTWISGPSATSDIELNRVEGVHGPRNLHVLVVGD